LKKEIIDKIDESTKEIIDNEDANKLMDYLEKERKSPEDILNKIIENIKKNKWDQDKIIDFLRKIRGALEKKAEWGIAFQKD